MKGPVVIVVAHLGSDYAHWDVRESANRIDLAFALEGGSCVIREAHVYASVADLAADLIEGHLELPPEAGPGAPLVKPRRHRQAPG